MSTPIAPLSNATSTFRLTEQAPRSINAILPVTLFRIGSAGEPAATEPAGQPRPMNATAPLVPLPIGDHSSVAVLPYVPAMPAGAVMTSGNARALGTCVCATLNTPGPIEGEPTTYGLFEQLPAEAMTTTPRSTASSNAAVRSSSTWP